MIAGVVCLGGMMKRSDVVIIGNGPSSLEKELGRTIDSYETVVRFNSYYPAIIKHRKTLGTKTNIWFTVPFVDTFRRPVDHVYYHTWGNLNGDKDYRDLKRNFRDKKVQPVPPESIKVIREKYKYWMPSTGLIAIFTLLESYSSVDITGFDWWTDDYEYIHFYNKTDLKIFNNTSQEHDPYKEKEIILSCPDRIRFI